jgi:hypothetical protein
VTWLGTRGDNNADKIIRRLAKSHVSTFIPEKVHFQIRRKRSRNSAGTIDDVSRNDQLRQVPSAFSSYGLMQAFIDGMISTTVAHNFQCSSVS